jgi:glutaredoxin
MKLRAPVAVFACAAALAASAQPLYRWTDETGRVHITDTPPPASARNVQPKKAGSAAAVEPQQPYQLAEAVRDFPVSLYTSPNCTDPCSAARTLLNKRGVPFKEVRVVDEQSDEELQQVSGGTDVPTLVVGRSVHRGYQQNAYDALLDSARYPRAGLLPPRAQAAPSDGAEPQPQAPAGPYAPRPPRN